MASDCIARFNAVNESFRDGLKLYVYLAMISIIAAWAWKLMAFPTVLPQSFSMVFYQQFVGESDGRECPSYPVCSLYAKEALDKHGWLVGSWLMLDRLIHEGDDMQANRWVIVDGERRFHDPLHRNDFWL